MLRGLRIRAISTAVPFFLLTLICEPFLQAQNSASTGIIDGRVEDPSGAVITDAAIISPMPVMGISKRVRRTAMGYLLSLPSPQECIPSRRPRLASGLR